MQGTQGDSRGRLCRSYLGGPHLVGAHGRHEGRQGEAGVRLGWPEAALLLLRVLPLLPLLLLLPTLLLLPAGCPARWSSPPSSMPRRACALVGPPGGQHGHQHWDGLRVEKNRVMWQ